MKIKLLIPTLALILNATAYASADIPQFEPAPSAGQQSENLSDIIAMACNFPDDVRDMTDSMLQARKSYFDSAFSLIDNGASLGRNNEVLLNIACSGNAWDALRHIIENHPEINVFDTFNESYKLIDLVIKAAGNSNNDAKAILNIINERN